MHGNARSSPLGRLGMVLRVIEEGEPVAQVARRVGLSRQCVSKWACRYREEGEAGLEDRSSRPRCSLMRTSPAVEGPGELLHMDVKKVPSIPPGGGWRVHGRATPGGRDGPLCTP